MTKKFRYSLVIIVLIAVMSVYVLRLIEWQFIDGEEYRAQSETNSTSYIKLESPRGAILDKDGNVLVENREVYNIVMNALEIDGDRNTALINLLSLMEENNVEWRDILPIDYVNGAYVFTQNSGEEIEYLKGENMLNLQENATVEECMQALIERYDCEEYDRELARDIISIRYSMTKAGFSISEPFVIAEDVSMEFVQIVSENSIKMPGIEIRLSSVREYTEGTLAPHIVGSMGFITGEQYEQFIEDENTFSSANITGYSYSEKIGQSGIEKAFEEELRGDSGKQMIETDEDGNLVAGDVVELPVPGNNVTLTLDSEMQRILNDSVMANVEAAITEDAVAGAAVVLDVETFGVLASSTYPSYDIERYNNDPEYYTMLIQDEDTPLFNRAFDGIFTPGSIIKPMTGIAGLQESVVSSHSSILCKGEYDYYEGEVIDCIGLHKAGESLNIYTGLASSCNTYFLEVGRLLEIDRLEVYANLFGLGVKTGVEISEASGIMTNPKQYEEIHQTDWVDGITTHAAIGQADDMFSPLQLATYTATIANDGVRLETHLLKSVTDYDNSVVVENHEPVIAEDIDLDNGVIEAVQAGMREAVVDGTATYPFGYYGIEIAAKTGTAENANHSPNSTFIAYAPYDDPEIAIAVVLEYADNGFLARNVAEDVFDYYFYEKTLEELQGARASEQAAAAAAAADDDE